MNILHMKYVVEVSKNGSINKASEKLLIAPPNLSRCVRDLEADLGIRIFERTNRGMRTTPEGEEFVRYARRILSQIDELEVMYKSPEKKKQHFSVSVPRASYISEAFARFTTLIGDQPVELFPRCARPLNTLWEEMRCESQTSSVVESIKLIPVHLPTRYFISDEPGQSSLFKGSGLFPGSRAVYGDRPRRSLCPCAAAVGREKAGTA